MRSRRLRAVTGPVLAALAATIVPLAPALAAEDPAVVVPDVVTVTPAQAEGPFYPVELPDDHDADLVHVAGQDGPASGTVLQLDGLLLTVEGQPLAGAVVEIWQTDSAGIYLHPDDPDVAARDAAFQGYGEAVTDSDGAWSFLTILPEVYGSRPRHIHAKVKLDDETVLTTQIYFSGGDIPAAGAVALTGTDADALITEAVLRVAEDGTEQLHAGHLLVVEPGPA